MSHTSQSKVLIVDDDQALSTMLAELLESEGFQCAAASNGNEGLAKVAGWTPDLVILDVMMPGDDGIATLRKLRETTHTPVLMLTAMGEDDDRILGLEAGADDYLAKPFVARELILRIRAILKRASRQSEPGAEQATDLSAGPLTLRPRQESARVHDAELALTGAEFRILEILVGNSGEVVSREQLTERALGRKLTPYDRALDTHISHLRRKLGKAPAGEQVQIRSVRSAGYKLVVH